MSDSETIWDGGHGEMVDAVANKASHMPEVAVHNALFYVQSMGDPSDVVAAICAGAGLDLLRRAARRAREAARLRGGQP